MPEVGNDADLALTFSFPVQIFMIAIGVGTGIGINALISKNLGQNNQEGASKACYNGGFLGLLFYVVFLLFGLFGAKPFIGMQASSIQDPVQKQRVIDMGGQYLGICCTLSIGQMMFTVFERFLQATGRTSESMIGQISGALLNILLDYVLIYPCGLGVAGAAYATVIGQFVSFIVDAVFHFVKDKEIKNRLSYLKPEWSIIKEIFIIGIPAMLMQALLSIMMLGTNMILSFSKYDAVTLQGSFGIYYKIQQIALFACFGMSNALISMTSFNVGLKDQDRVKQIQKYGILDTVFVALIITVLFETFASPISKLFGLASGESGEGIVSTTTLAIRIASIGFPFMAFTVAAQGILQGKQKIFQPLILSFLRLVVFAFPFVFLFIQFENAKTLLWFVFPCAEILTDVVTYLFMKAPCRKSVRLSDGTR